LFSRLGRSRRRFWGGRLAAHLAAHLAARRRGLGVDPLHFWTPRHRIFHSALIYERRFTQKLNLKEPTTSLDMVLQQASVISKPDSKERDEILLF